MNKTKIVKEYLEAGNVITDMKAVELCKSYRLSGIIYNLRHDYRMNIQDRWIENENTGTRYKEYYYVKDDENEIL
jgi:hypothetical protein